jgi:CubicO group peptidase (beta-lactamase class C family)
MTAIAALQCVERGLLELDTDIAKILPEAGSHGIITGFDEVKNEAVLVPKRKGITLR